MTNCKSYHVTAIYVLMTNMPFKAIYANYLVCRYQTCMALYVPHIN